MKQLQHNNGEQLWFENPIDHFNFGPMRLKMFKQRYYINNLRDSSSSNYTAVLQIGGEGPHTGAASGINILTQVADKHSIVFALEHRFYGLSHPFVSEDGKPDVSNDKLKYLSSRQAIADLKRFVVEMDRQFCPDPAKVQPGKPCLNWFSMAGSYPGALSAWLTQLHDSWFVAALASSAVVNAIYNGTNFDLHTSAVAGAPCQAGMMIAHREIEANLQDFKVQTSLQDANDKDVLYFVADVGLSAFQSPSWGKLCKNMSEIYRSSGNVTQYYIDYIKNNSGFDFYNRESVRKLDIGENDNCRQWWYQTCTELAYFNPAPRFNSLRSQSINLGYYNEICKFGFDIELGDPTQRTNYYYGATKISRDRIFFSNFWQDIWHLPSIYSPPAENVGYVHCRECAHCRDFSNFQDTAPQEIKDLNQKELDFFAKMLEEWTAVRK